MGSSYPEDHRYARGGAPIGAAIWRSPEALFKRPWDTKTDIWSFGTLVSDRTVRTAMARCPLTL